MPDDAYIPLRRRKSLRCMLLLPQPAADAKHGYTASVGRLATAFAQ